MLRNLLIGCLTLLGIIVSGIILLALTGPVHTSSSSRACMAVMKMQSASLTQYAMDYDDCLPDSYWMDRVAGPAGYVRGHDSLRCASLEFSKTGQFGYAFNAMLAGKSIERLIEPENVLLTYESTNREKNAYSLNSPFSTRHDGLGNVSFADGHVDSIDRPRFDRLMVQNAPHWKKPEEKP